MAHRVCPWWLGYLLLNPLRRYRQNPAQILSSHVRAGMTVLEPGPGMGFFTLELARLVGVSGKVIAVDVQPRMIEKLRSRADKAGMLDRLDLRVVPPESLNIVDLAGAVDFIFAFFVVHEFPDTGHLFTELAAASKPGATLLIAEPTGHVDAATFESELDAASRAGFRLQSRPRIHGSRAALLKREKC